jgi:tetratricopeptide (TPR) repeat protein
MHHNDSSAFRSHSATVCLLALLVLSGCSLPRIIILNDPLSVEEHNDLGRIYESQSKYDLAAQQYQEALRIDKKSIPTLLLLGDLSYRTRNYSEAESAYKRAIKLDPLNGDIYNNLSWVYLEQNSSLDKAEELMRQALTMNPEHRAYYLDTMGVVLLRLGRVAESISALKEATALLPREDASELSEAYAHLAEAYRVAGDTVNALEAEQSAAKYRARIPPKQ